MTPAQNAKLPRFALGGPIFPITIRVSACLNPAWPNLNLPSAKVTNDYGVL
jgi:hypothetical protein